MLTHRSVWNPWRELEALSRDVASTFAPDRRGSMRRWSMDWVDDGPAFNVYTKSDGVLLTAELPGFDPDSIEVAAERDTITITGRRDEDLAEGEQVHLAERGAVAFEKRFRLPFTVNSEQVDALFDKGVLTVRLARPEEEQPKKIGVRRA